MPKLIYQQLINEEVMPKAFETCVKKGGRVRRKVFPGNRYVNVCYINGKAYVGNVHKMGKEMRKKKMD